MILWSSLETSKFIFLSVESGFNSSEILQEFWKWNYFMGRWSWFGGQHLKTFISGVSLSNKFQIHYPCACTLWSLSPTIFCVSLSYNLAPSLASWTTHEMQNPILIHYENEQSDHSGIIRWQQSCILRRFNPQSPGTVFWSKATEG